MSQAANRQPIPVGEYFLERGKITQKQLELALQHRAEFNLKLGQSLVELGFVNETDMVEALKNQARFPCIHLTPGIVDKRIARKLGELESRRHRAIVLNQVAGHSTVALEDPSDVQVLEKLSHLLATRILPVYAEPSAIRGLIDEVFGRSKSVSKPRPPESAAPLPKPASKGEPGATPLTSEPAKAEDAPDERSVVERVRNLLQSAFDQGVSDLHLEARRDALLVRFRVAGNLREHARLSAAWTAPVLTCLKSLAKLDGKDGGPQQGRIPFVFKKQDFKVRLATTPSLHGESAVLHIQRSERMTRKVAELGLQEEQLLNLEAILEARSGLVLVAGPARSGRTTTMYALLERLATKERKVAMLEERVEQELEGVLQMQLDRRSGLGFAACARALALQDADLLFLSDIDGRETAEVALAAALEPRLVVAGLRANGACEAIARFGLEPYLLAEALRGVIAQRLVRRICPECKAPMVPDETLSKRLGLIRDGATYHEGAGCAACLGTGYQGHAALFEVLAMEPALRRAIEKGEDAGGLARATGFASLRDGGLRLARAGETTLHEVMAATPHG